MHPWKCLYIDLFEREQFLLLSFLPLKMMPTNTLEKDYTYTLDAYFIKGIMILCSHLCMSATGSLKYASCLHATGILVWVFSCETTQKYKIHNKQH